MAVAYVKPIGYRAAYGTEKHEDYFHEMGERALAGQLPRNELDHLRAELDTMASRGTLSAEMRALRERLAGARAAPPAPAEAAAAEASPAPAAAGGA
ncbi:MAG: hypothetical protein OEW22_01035 [Rubrivivax sp.]|nr:hypothetical protein [Rubrivivax sp.]